MLETLIDVVHDLIESGVVTEHTVAAFRRGFVDGASGTWESTGAWLRKAGSEYPVLSELWLEFASDRSAATRFRAAAFIGDMPEHTARVLLPRLLSDPSIKVRTKVAGNQFDTKREWVASLLLDRRGVESESAVLEAIDFALDSIRGRA